MITSAILKKIFPSTPAAKRDRFIPALNKYLPLYGIITAKRVRAFLATGGVETDYLKVTVEYASGDDYEGRSDLGNTQKGDGRKYKGRGFFQTTGRYNYLICLIRFVNRLTGKNYTEKQSPQAVVEANRLGVNFLAHPEKLAEIETAIESACIFWRDNNLAKYADAQDFKNFSSVVNCGKAHREPNQWTKRRALYNLCVAVIPDDFSFPPTSQNYDDPARTVPVEDFAPGTDFAGRILTEDKTAQSVSSLKEIGTTVFVHTPRDTVKNITVVIGTRILAGIITIWSLGLHGQIFLIAAVLISLGFIVWAFYRYSSRVVSGIKRIVEYFFG